METAWRGPSHPEITPLPPAAKTTPGLRQATWNPALSTLLARRFHALFPPRALEGEAWAVPGWACHCLPPKRLVGSDTHEAMPTAPQPCLRETPLSGALPCCFPHSVLSGSSLSWSVLTWDLDQSWVQQVQEASHVTWLGLALGAGVQKPPSSRDWDNYTCDFPAFWPCSLLSTPYLASAMVSLLSTAKARIPRAGLSSFGLGFLGSVMPLHFSVPQGEEALAG